MNVIVFGSINMDLVIRTQRFPEPGETLTGRTFFTASGGKGANQAVASAKLGAATTLIGRVGNDVFSTTLLDGLQENSVNTDLIYSDPEHPSGTALITVDDAAENTIIIIPGANGNIGIDDIARLKSVLSDSGYLLLQLEVPIKMVIAAAQSAHAHNTCVILDPAPAQEIPEALYPLINVITPNETETAALTGFPLNNEADAVQAVNFFHERGVEQVIIKMGSKGALWSNIENTHFFPAYHVEAIDTVAAGDAFNGALAAGLSEGLTMMDAIQWAMAVGALSTTKEGAQPSMPDRQTVLRFMEK
jgi:ribokinase